MKKYDYIIIGGGPAGYTLAMTLASDGNKTALVSETHEVGGTCLNCGCIPTKALLASAVGYAKLQNIEELGLSCGNVSYDLSKISERKTAIVENLKKGVLGGLKKSGVELFDSRGKLMPDKKVLLEKTGETIEADKIVLATGSKAVVPSFVPQDRNLFMSSDEALLLKDVPENLLVIGGGVIGIELAQVYSFLGSKVVIAEMADQILPGLDKAVAKRLLAEFKKNGIEINVSSPAENLQKTADGKVSAKIKGEERLFDKALVAIGRKPALSCFDESAQVELDGAFIKTNDKFETSVPGVYALGDLIKGPMLAHKASYDARIFYLQQKGQEIKADYDWCPGCVYTLPEIAWVGKSEDALKAEGITYKTGKSLYSANGKALSAGASSGQAKVLLSENNELLGASIWGDSASLLIQSLNMAGKFALKAEDILNLIVAHPTLSEILSEAFENALR